MRCTYSVIAVQVIEARPYMCTYSYVKHYTPTFLFRADSTSLRKQVLEVDGSAARMYTFSIQCSCS